MPEPLLSVEDVSVAFGASGRRASVLAVDRAGFRLEREEILAIAGASGSGKTTLARVVLGLLRPDSGSVAFRGRPWPPRRRRDRMAIQGVFQDSLEAFDPGISVSMAAGEALLDHRLVRGKRELRAAVAPLLEQVGLDPAFMDRTARSLSGGERQRLALARAIAPGPEILVLDEPVSSLDAASRRDVIALLRRLREELKMAILLISHELDVIEALEDRILVMMAGRIVETGRTGEVLADPRHPWTGLLLQARSGRMVAPEDQDLARPCPFSACPARSELCDRVRPELPAPGPGRRFACHHPLGPPLAGAPVE